ncbi:AAA domain-containing protein [Dyadobacter sp. SG02]|uniref:ParA family protein n=1 Tax=Dyadobacter sp. SG02 TaxID=1855291 RepID=UPI0008AFBE66|nr:ParA family protein [Dyadobacter sp. SG02]SEJ74662.1 AAA domain-containing protein [Dyadobacter sp. SG02]
MTLSQKIINFLEGSSLSISAAEREAGIPARTINKAISNGTEIPSKHVPGLVAALRKYGFSTESKAKVISIVNNKGGVGKTTTTINLGKALVVEGYRVLLVDMDTQGNLSQCFNVDVPDKQVIDTLLDKNKPLPLVEIESNLFVSPSDIRMSAKESELINSVGGDRRLATALSPLKGDFDFILLDCPPATNILTTNCLVASDSCIIPIQPEASAYFGVENLMERIKQIRDYSNSSLTVSGIVFTLVQKNQNVHKQMMTHISETFKSYRIFKTMIEMSTIIKQSQVARQDLFVYDPESKPADQYLKIARELLSL